MACATDSVSIAALKIGQAPGRLKRRWKSPDSPCWRPHVKASFRRASQGEGLAQLAFRVFLQDGSRLDRIRVLQHRSQSQGSSCASNRAPHSCPDQLAVEFVEAAEPFEKLMQHEPFPTTSNEAKRRLDRARELSVGSGHGIPLPAKSHRGFLVARMEVLASGSASWMIDPGRWTSLVSLKALPATQTGKKHAHRIHQQSSLEG